MLPENAKANITITPEKSQTFLVSIAVVAGTCLVLGAALLSQNNIYGILFLLIAVFLLVLAFHAWHKAQRDTDRTNAHKTEIQVGAGNIATDSRMLTDREFVKGITEVISVVTSREPLPIPEGLLDEHQELIPRSQQPALDLTNRINADVETLKKMCIEKFGRTGRALPIEIPSNIVDAPVIEEVPNLNVPAALEHE